MRDRLSMNILVIECFVLRKLQITFQAFQFLDTKVLLQVISCKDSYLDFWQIADLWNKL